MMPIFFNLASHGWLLLFLQFNGLMLALFVVKQIRPNSSSVLFVEVLVLAGFFLSLLLNYLIFYIAEWVALSTAEIILLFCLLSCFLIVLNLYSLTAEKGYFCDLTITWERGLCYLFVFIILFYNGGLIEQIADSWWHMVLANKVALTGVEALQKGHLVEDQFRPYPSLWHINLALINRVSEISLPVLWNSATAWVGVFKIMAFYTLAYVLSGRRLVAMLSCLLFLLLPGIGSSFMRVSAWPSHISYTAMFAGFSLAISFLHQARTNVMSGQFLKEAVTKLFALIGLVLVMWLVHKAEVFWWALGVSCYSWGCLVAGRFTWFEIRGKWLEYFSVITLIATWLMCIAVLIPIYVDQTVLADQLLAYLLPVWLLLLFIFVALTEQRKWTLLWLALFFASILLSVNYQHVMSLYFPEFALPRSPIHEQAISLSGLYGGHLLLPGWHLQLREGLQYSAVISIALGCVCYRYIASRVVIFSLSLSILVFVICSSPYLYYWLTTVLNYHSAWRVAVLSFHPILIGAVLAWVIDGTRYRKALVWKVSLLVLLSFVGWEARQHFDKSLLQIKREHRSAQRNWNLFYTQKYVWYEGGIRYAQEFKEIQPLIEPNSIVFADLPTSYYSASHLPVYVKNVHRHHGGQVDSRWRNFIQRRPFCYIDQANNRHAAKRFFKEVLNDNPHRSLYIILNTDQQNRNLRYDCLWHKRDFIQPLLADFGEVVFVGDNLLVVKVAE